MDALAILLCFVDLVDLEEFFNVYDFNCPQAFAYFANNNIEGEAKEVKDHTPIENVVFMKCS
jgi:hypothetical protein